MAISNARRWALLLASSLALGGAARAADPAPAPPTDDNAAYVVIGVQPLEATPEMMPGSLDDKHKFVSGGRDRIEQDPQDGYLVLKLDSEDTLAIEGVWMGSSHAYGRGLIGLMGHELFDKSGHQGKGYNTFCGADSALATFTPRRGHVLYIADFTFSQTDGGYWGSVDSGSYPARDLDAAKAYLKTHYPALADRVEQGPMTYAVVAGGCGPEP